MIELLKKLNSDLHFYACREKELLKKLHVLFLQDNYNKENVGNLLHILSVTKNKIEYINELIKYFEITK